MTQNEFKIGDKVRIKDHPCVNPDYVGRICEIASVGEGASITFKDCDSYWHPEVLELVEPLDRKTAFLTELQALLRKYDAVIDIAADYGYSVGVSLSLNGEEVIHDTEVTELHADNIMDFDDE